MSFHRAILLAASVAALACSRSSQHEEYGFVATLGNDTTSIEHITRSGRSISSDVVERNPRVFRKHWEATLNEDGTLRRWTMDKDILNPRADETPRTTFTADFSGDSVIVTQSSGNQSNSYIMKNVLPVTVPWESYVYGLYELLFEAALKQPNDTVPVQQYLPGSGLSRGAVRKHSADSITFTTGGLAGTGVAKVDGNGRMISYTGKHTTYKQEVKRLSDAPDIAAIATRFAALEKATPVRSMSMRDTARAQIGNAEIAVDYSRPLRRGRDVLGKLVPYDAVWRTGANAATQLMVSAPITIAGSDVEPGTYTLWTLPTADGARLIINKQFGQWGTRYNAQMDLARVALQTQTLPTPTDTFSIRIEPTTARAGNLVIEWDRFRWSAPINARN